MNSEEKAVCIDCVDDPYLKEIVQQDGNPAICSVCSLSGNIALTVGQLGQLMEPIMREHFQLGPLAKHFGVDDSEWWEQEGEDLSWVVQQVLGQGFDFEDELIYAVINAEDAWPPDGDEGFWDRTSNYVEKKITLGHYFARWEYTLDELKHNRRFFSSAAQSLFANLFVGLEKLKGIYGKQQRPVVRNLPSNTRLFRARICNSRAILKNILEDPFRHVGPPPPDLARAGRMNAEGVVVLYAALDVDTCLAEMRPAIGNELASITLETAKPLRMLDFTRLERARQWKALSYFQSDFSEQIERPAFLRRLHRLISQPIVPGKESDYLITQTMAEYLAHVHEKPFDGILFSSSQQKNGINAVLFAEKNLLTSSNAAAFRVMYIEDSLKFFTTSSLRYKHQEITALLDNKGNVWVQDSDGDPADEDWME